MIRSIFSCIYIVDTPEGRRKSTPPGRIQIGWADGRKFATQVNFPINIVNRDDTSDMLFLDNCREPLVFDMVRPLYEKRL